jgi:Fe-S oxidoreductase
MSEPRTEHVPGYRLKKVLELYRRRGAVDAEVLETLRDVAFGTCTMCQRCSMYCPHGISVAFLMSAARGICKAAGVAPEGLMGGLGNQLDTGNNLAVTEEEFIETVEWQAEELQEEMEGAVAPINKPGAEYLLTLHPKDVKFYPQNLYNYLKLYNACGLDFTLTSRGWDGTNVGMFAGDPAAGGKVVGEVFAAAERLGVKKVITAE